MFSFRYRLNWFPKPIITNVDERNNLVIGLICGIFCQSAKTPRTRKSSVSLICMPLRNQFPQVLQSIHIKHLNIG